MDDNDLSANELYVLLDATSGKYAPWLDYSDPNDPKSTVEGWSRLLHSARMKLERQAETT